MLINFRAAASLKFAIVVSFISLGVLVLFAIMALVSGAADFGSLYSLEKKRHPQACNARTPTSPSPRDLIAATAAMLPAAVV